jgi:hypothetical protein
MQNLEKQDYKNQRDLLILQKDVILKMLFLNNWSN